ncbi:hypothetical protein SY88_05565 [Clostridiales bacterium PH28_bin88]|nr:hypothetical protein SY88_05565 [Clostridiales bacterium PH28_bin88]
MVRPARAEEAQGISELALRSKAAWGYDAEFLDRCRPSLTLTPDDIRSHPVFVAEAEGVVGGFYSLRRRGSELELDNLFIEPARMRQGVGSILLEHALEHTKRLGYERMLVESDPWAEGFYLHAGGVRIREVASTVQQGRFLPLIAFDLKAPL